MIRLIISLVEPDFIRHILHIATKSSQESSTKYKPGTPVWGRILQALSYVGVCAWLIWIATTEKSEAEMIRKLDTIVFADFFGYFLIALLFSGADQSVRWRWPPSFDEFLKIAGYGILILAAGWFMEGIAGWPFTIAWMLGLVLSLTDIPGLRSGAIIRVIWAFVSAFLVALVSSFAGVTGENSLTEHLPSLLSWGLLYFGGVAIFRFFRIALLHGERPDITNSVD